MRFFSRLSLLAVLFLTISLPLAPASAQQLPSTTRLLRFPTTNGAQIVFCYAGELYTVGQEGGIARRLTSGPGYSSFPRFSPDGAQLAFTSHYDGNTEVYVMPGEGGEPKRLTTTATLGRDDISDRMGPNNLVMTWQNTKPQIVFRSRMKSYNSFNGELFAVGLDAELPKQLPLPRTHGGSAPPSCRPESLSNLLLHMQQKVAEQNKAMREGLPRTRNPEEPAGCYSTAFNRRNAA